MKTLVVDVPSGLADATGVLTALKIFALKNKFYDLLICGYSGDFSVLEDNVNIRCDYIQNSQTSANLALSHLKNTDVAGFLSFSKRELLLKEAHSVLPKEVSPFFSGRDSEKETLLIDAGGFGEFSQDNIEGYLSYAMDFLTNIVRKPRNEISIGLLAFSESLSKADEDIDSVLKTLNANYRGYVSPGELLNSNFAVVLSGGPMGQVCISAANAAKKIQVNAQIIQTSKNIFGKWSGNNQPARTDDFDAKGYYLFGYGHHIYSLSSQAHYQNVITALTALERFDRNQPRN
jgi:fatty acid/phospholipid biosynthesis enzyme